MADFPIGTRVRFREDSPQHAALSGITFIVEASPSGAAVSMDNTHEGGVRPYVWLVHADDVSKVPSRQRRRSGYVTALEEA